ncbi:hypothetical protein BKA57DRAFT_469081 [Linnemannia elongata]|nr:hypothetical protein BKA57DRAFT_469081 [Linnemannia elongata]
MPLLLLTLLLLHSAFVVVLYPFISPAPLIILSSQQWSLLPQRPKRPIILSLLLLLLLLLLWLSALSIFL